MVLSQEFDSDIIDLVKQKRFYPYAHIINFEKFKENCQAKNWTNKKLVLKDTILNMTKIELEINSDDDKYLFFEKGKKGGVSYISKR